MWEIKAGDIIGDTYKIIEKIGQGGFGVVYKALELGTNSIKALKTIRPDIVLSDEIKYRYIKEAEVWIELGGCHPFIVPAFVVEKFVNKIFIVTGYIEPNANGINSLDSHFLINKPDLKQILIWAIQFCFGMEYAYSKSIKAHRDIKPSNIMIDTLGNVRINDFGLSGIIRSADFRNMPNLEYGTDDQTRIGIGSGTPSHMAPEQFVDVASCDQRSDIYSFGVVLFQMVSGGDLPFDSKNKGQYWQIMKYQHEATNPPSLNSPLFPLIKQCMEKGPFDRIQTFTKLRVDLEKILASLFNVKVNCEFEDLAPVVTLLNKGLSFESLGKYEEAVDCYDKALNLNPTDKYLHSSLFNNKATVMKSLNRYEEALALYDKAISIRNNEDPWFNKGLIYHQQYKYDDSIYCYNNAIKLNPNISAFYSSKADSLKEIKQYDEALYCWNKAININPKNLAAIFNKGLMYYNMSKYGEAMKCIDDTLAINSEIYEAWYYKAKINSINQLFTDALNCYENALSLNPNHPLIHEDKAVVLIKLALYSEAISSLNIVLEKDPNNLMACKNMAFALYSTGNFKRALIVTEHALTINSTDKWAIDFKQSVLAKLNPVIKPIP